MGEFMWGFVFFLTFTLPAYVLPLVIGPIILIFFGRDELNRMAGLFTLKPLLATPLWLLTLGWGKSAGLSDEFNPLLGLIPGVGLTLLIVWGYSHLLRTESGMVTVLLLGDALRWLNTLALMTTGRSIESPFYMVGLILPNAYAVMALAIVWLRKRSPRDHEQFSPQ